MILSRMVLEFLAFSIGGWVFESILGIVKTQKWEKRGFLYGPVCPIYGVGACGALTLARLLAHTTLSYTWWQVFLVAFIGSAILEYGTSWTLERLFHAYWWDYSDMPLNINGRICLPASTLFGCLGVFIVYQLLPKLTNYELRFPELFYEFIAMVIVALFSVDITLTASALTNFASAVDALGDNLNQHMEAVVDGMNDISRGAIMRVRGFRFRPSESGRKERMEKALEMIRRKNMLQYAKAAGRFAKETAVAAGQATKEKALEVSTATKEKAMAVGAATKARVLAAGQTVREDTEVLDQELYQEIHEVEEKAVEIRQELHAVEEKAVEIREEIHEVEEKAVEVGKELQKAEIAQEKPEIYLEMVQNPVDELQFRGTEESEPEKMDE